MRIATFLSVLILSLTTMAKAEVVDLGPAVVQRVLTTINLADCEKNWSVVGSFCVVKTVAAGTPTEFIHELAGDKNKLTLTGANGTTVSVFVDANLDRYMISLVDHNARVRFDFATAKPYISELMKTLPNQKIGVTVLTIAN